MKISHILEGNMSFSKYRNNEITFSGLFDHTGRNTVIKNKKNCRNLTHET